MNLGVLLTPNTSVYEYGVGAPGNSGNRCCILGYYGAIMVQTLQALRYAPGHSGIEMAGGNRGEY